MTADAYFIGFLKGFIFPHECIYDEEGRVISENDPDDPGGLTKYGIDYRSYPNVDIENLTEDDAIKIYWREFHLCAAYSLPRGIREAFFDGCVNTGKSQTTKHLQRAIGVEADGFLGPVTIEKLETFHNPWDVITPMLERRRGFYRLIASSGKQKFLKGWLARVDDLEIYLKKII